MTTYRFFRPSCLRSILILLGVEAALLLVLWLLYEWLGWMNRLAFTDVLFIIATILLAVAGFGLMGHRDDAAYQPGHGVQALPVEASEKDKFGVLAEAYMRQYRFSLRLAAISGLTILASAVWAFLIK